MCPKYSVMSTEKPSLNNEKETEKKEEPEKVSQEEKGGFENRPEPTRYGDWEVGGRCSDF